MSQECPDVETSSLKAHWVRKALRPESNREPFCCDCAHQAMINNKHRTEKLVDFNQNPSASYSWFISSLLTNFSLFQQLLHFGIPNPVKFVYLNYDSVLTTIKIYPHGVSELADLLKGLSSEPLIASAWTPKVSITIQVTCCCLVW